MKIVVALVLGLAGACVVSAASERNYSHAIEGSWIYSSKVRPMRIIVFHADGSWGVRKFDDRAEDIRGRRWKVEGDSLVLRYPSDHRFDTRIDKIVSFTSHKFVTEQQGYRFTYTRIEQPH